MRLAAFVLLLMTWLAPGSVWATVTGGRVAQLLAVNDQQLAIVAEHDLQGEPELRVYQVDLTSEVFVRRSAVVLSASDEPGSREPRALFQLYSSRLPPAEQTKLRSGVKFVDELTALRVRPGRAQDPSKHFPYVERVEFAGLGVSGRAELVELWTTRSMAMYDRAGGGFDQCMSGGQALCSSCAPSMRWVNGEKTDTWECHGQGTRLSARFRSASEVQPDESAGAACLCDARAKMLQLVLKVGQRTVRGTKLLVEPFRTWQLGDGQPPHVNAGLGGGTGEPTLEFYLTPAGTLIAVGSAAHIPWGNGTHFPVFATFVGASAQH